jgi:hypothetical protein
MTLTYHERRLIKVLEENPDINTRRFIALAKLGKATFYQYSQLLEASGYIGYSTVKNQRIWYLVRRDKRHDLGVQDIEDSVLEQRYRDIKSKVMSSLGKIRKGNMTDKIDIYGDAVVLILATLGSMKLVSIYRRKRVPPSYAKFSKRLELLLEKISDAKFFSDYGFGRTAIDIVSYEVESRLDEFLGIKKDKKVSIY